ncbi:hypothetical protein [Desulfobulbus alkaliphilus]|nr:hypothetical protein [Desulfobulbus alkaliphilus]MBM9537719.1 hypothetical protein [Desulfobulbus alkaliphilus]
MKKNQRCQAVFLHCGEEHHLVDTSHQRTLFQNPVKKTGLVSKNNIFQ